MYLSGGIRAPADMASESEEEGDDENGSSSGSDDDDSDEEEDEEMGGGGWTIKGVGMKVDAAAEEESR
jgi:hypothetical protein